MSMLKSSFILLKKDSSHKENVSKWEFCEFKVKFVYHIIFVVWADGVLEDPVEIGVNTAVKLFCPTQIVVQKGTINGHCNKKNFAINFFFSLCFDIFFTPYIHPLSIYVKQYLSYVEERKKLDLFHSIPLRVHFDVVSWIL